jgi:hypothetical protein
MIAVGHVYFLPETVLCTHLMWLSYGRGSYIHPVDMTSVYGIERSPDIMDTSFEASLEAGDREAFLGKFQKMSPFHSHY